MSPVKMNNFVIVYFMGFFKSLSVVLF